MYIPSDNTANAAISFISGIPAYVAAFVSQSDITLISAIVLPCVFFFLGKAVDVCVRVYLESRKKE